ncbi:Transcription factor bhlh [Thalictrum thalictroides]|uniref:Transcription factor bhlh n=1 Tax=Thalictrum thalictroides TaxID=46969 RepID=A0A7J6VN28_THATH|nr:Transcription factor bhlh [Thalictrum thalictroides]
MDSEYYFPPLSMSFNNLEKMAEIPSSCSSSSVFAFPPILTSNFQKLPKLEPIDSSLNDEWMYQLPNLRSVKENNKNTKNLPMSASTKRFRSSSVTSSTTTTHESYTLEAIVRNHLHPPPSSSSPLLVPSTSSLLQNERARKRRKEISEKTRLLAKLMPWEKKMDTATLFGEAYKYIKFLQAQVKVFQSMPYQSSFISSSSSQPPPFGGVVGGRGVTSTDFGGLEKLNRQQLLQVLVNSPGAQTAFSSQQCCVYSLEQVVWLKKNLQEQMFLLGSSFGPYY